MNNNRRQRLRNALKMLESASEIVDQVYDEESDCLSNYPENLQNTDRYEQMESAVDALSEATSAVSEAIGNIRAALDE